MKLFTIGFTKTSAEHFFARLQEAKVERVVDVRLNNVSQLAGFAKRDDLRYFLDVIGGIKYTHLPELAPTKEILDGYKKGKLVWAEYEKRFNELIANRRIEERVAKDIIDQGCLLCSEDTPDRCHRRLVAEYLQHQWGGVEIFHL